MPLGFQSLDNPLGLWYEIEHVQVGPVRTARWTVFDTDGNVIAAPPYCYCIHAIANEHAEDFIQTLIDNEGHRPENGNVDN